MYPRRSSTERARNLPFGYLAAACLEVYEICARAILANECLDSPLTAAKFKITFREVLPALFIHHSRPVVWTVTVPANLVRAFLSRGVSDRRGKSVTFVSVLLQCLQFVFAKRSAIRTNRRNSLSRAASRTAVDHPNGNALRVYE